MCTHEIHVHVYARMHALPVWCYNVSNTHLSYGDLYNTDRGILPLPCLEWGEGGGGRGLVVLTSSTCPRSWFIRDVSPGSLAPYDLCMPRVHIITDHNMMIMCIFTAIVSHWWKLQYYECLATINWFQWQFSYRRTKCLTKNCVQNRAAKLCLMCQRCSSHFF